MNGRAGRQKNSAFFDNHGGNKNSTSNKLSTNLVRLLKQARETGNLNLNSQSLVNIPDSVFSIEESLQDDEKFWEVNPLTKVDLSFNEIVTISPSISKLIDLNILKCRNNKLCQLPPELFTLPLRHLDFSNNRLLAIPSEVQMLLDLKELLLSSNELNSLPEGILNCQSLQILDIQNNRISHLPSEIAKLQNLLTLMVSNNSLVELPMSFGYLTQLKTFECRHNSLLELPDLTNMSSLTYIDAGENKIREFPFLPRSGQLGRIHLGQNNITQINRQCIQLLLEQSSTLFELHLQGNQLTELPAEIAYLFQLKVLDISNNSISNIPAPLGYMKSLQRLVLDGNPIRSMKRSLIAPPSSAGQITSHTMDIKTFLRTRGDALPGMIIANTEDVMEKEDNDMDVLLVTRVRQSCSTGGAVDLSGLGSTHSIPMDLGNKLLHMTVTSLNLSANDLKMIPDLSSLNSLKSLDLTGNKLGSITTASIEVYQALFEIVDNMGEEFSSSLHCFPISLTSLTLSSNNLNTKSLDTILSACCKNHSSSSIQLTVLTASNNKLTELPQILERCTSLREITIPSNQIGSIREIDWSMLTALETLNLSDNRLKASELFPLWNMSSSSSSSSSSPLPPLRTLILDNNDLSEVPPELALFTKLRYLGLQGNPQRSVRTTVIQQGTEAILSLLKMRLGPGITASNTTSPLPPPPNAAHITVPVQAAQALVVTAGSVSKANSFLASSRNSQPTPSSNPPHAHQIQYPTTTTTAVSGSHEVGKDSSLINKLRGELELLESQLEGNNSSLSEAKRFAMKKEIAKKRANILRVTRSASGDT